MLTLLFICLTVFTSAQTAMPCSAEVNGKCVCQYGYRFRANSCYRFDDSVKYVRGGFSLRDFSPRFANNTLRYELMDYITRVVFDYSAIDLDVSSDGTVRFRIQLIPIPYLTPATLHYKFINDTEKLGYILEGFLSDPTVGPLANVQPSTFTYKVVTPSMSYDLGYLILQIFLSACFSIWNLEGPIFRRRLHSRQFGILLLSIVILYNNCRFVYYFQYNSKASSAVFFLTIIFLLVPLVINVLYVGYVLFKETLRSERFVIFVQEKNKQIAAISLLSALHPENLLLLESNLLYLRQFRGTFTGDAIASLRVGGFLVPLFGVIPLFVVQLLFTIPEHQDDQELKERLSALAALPINGIFLIISFVRFLIFLYDWYRNQLGEFYDDLFAYKDPNYPNISREERAKRAAVGKAVVGEPQKVDKDEMGTSEETHVVEGESQSP